jgi:hypothetical protein
VCKVMEEGRGWCLGLTWGLERVGDAGVLFAIWSGGSWLKAARELVRIMAHKIREA